jgi:hypothetical protein
MLLGRFIFVFFAAGDASKMACFPSPFCGSRPSLVLCVDKCEVKTAVACFDDGVACFDDGVACFDDGVA